MSFFDDVNPTQSELAKLKTAKKTLSGKTEVKQLDSMAEEQGWIDRQPKKPGPKRREKRTVLTMNGPARVLDEFRHFADSKEISQWRALELLMSQAGLLNNPNPPV